jgi:hypothetical protein
MWIYVCEVVGGLQGSSTALSWHCFISITKDSDSCFTEANVKYQKKGHDRLEDSE